MKKRIVTLLCTAILTVGLAAAPAMASDAPYRPIEVESYTYGPLDELRISKVYRLSQYDDPSGIPTEDFVRGDRLYFLLDMTVDETDCEVVTYTAIFGSVELTRDERYAGTSDRAGIQTQHADFGNAGISPRLLPVLTCAGGVVMVAVAWLSFYKSKNTGVTKCE